MNVLIEPLRPEPVPVLATTRPSWAHFISSFEPPVRDLRPGDRPQEWANDDERIALDAIGTPVAGRTQPEGNQIHARLSIARRD